MDYIQDRTFREDMKRARQKTIETEAKDYAIIGDLLYKRGKDYQLCICANESEYVPILEQAHAGQSGGHFSAKMTA